MTNLRARLNELAEDTAHLSVADRTLIRELETIVTAGERPGGRFLHPFVVRNVCETAAKRLKQLLPPPDPAGAETRPPLAGPG